MIRRSLIVFLLLLVPAAQALEPGPAAIRVTLRQTDVDASEARTVRSFAILNRPAYRRPIGTAALICWGNGARRACSAYFQFSRGQIIAGGLVRNLGFYTLAVGGGTGYYDNVGGTVVVQQIGGDAWSVVIGLQGFG